MIVVSAHVCSTRLWMISWSIITGLDPPWPEHAPFKKLLLEVEY